MLDSLAGDGQASRPGLFSFTETPFSDDVLAGMLRCALRACFFVRSPGLYSKKGELGQKGVSFDTKVKRVWTGKEE